MLLEGVNNLLLALVQDEGGKGEEEANLFGREKLEVAEKSRIIGGYAVVRRDEDVKERKSFKASIIEADQRADVIGVNPLPISRT